MSSIAHDVSDDNDSSFEFIDSDSDSDEESASLALADDSNHEVRKLTSEATTVASGPSGFEFESESKLDAPQTQATAVPHQIDAKEPRTPEQPIQPLLKHLPGYWRRVGCDPSKTNFLNFELTAAGQIRIADYFPEGQLVGTRIVQPGFSKTPGRHDFIVDDRWVTILSAEGSGIGCKALIETWIANYQLMVTFVSKDLHSTNVYEKVREDRKPLSGMEKAEEKKLPILQEISGSWELITIRSPAFSNSSTSSCDIYFIGQKTTFNAYSTGADIYHFTKFGDASHHRTAKFTDKEAAFRNEEGTADYIENNQWISLSSFRGEKRVRRLENGKLLIAVEVKDHNLTLVYERTHSIKIQEVSIGSCFLTFLLGVMIFVLMLTYMRIWGNNC